MPDFNAKIHQNRFRLGLRPRPRWGSLQCSPDPLAGFKGPTSKGRGGDGRGEEGRGGEGKGGEEREGGLEGPPPCKILNTPLNGCINFVCCSMLCQTFIFITERSELRNKQNIAIMS